LNPVIRDVDARYFAVACGSPIADVEPQRLTRSLGNAVAKWYLQNHAERICRFVSLKRLIHNVIAKNEEQSFSQGLHPRQAVSKAKIFRHFVLIPGMRQ
jgi:hypothetical protein